LEENKKQIIRKLMIAQRKQFESKHQKQKLKSKLIAETSISNFSQISDLNEQQHYSDNYRLLYDVWDTARIVDTEETYEQRVHFFHLSLQILKVFTYIVLSLVVLLSAIVSKGSFLLMTNAIGHLMNTNEHALLSTTTTTPPVEDIIVNMKQSSSTIPPPIIPYRERWIWMLLSSICIPYLFTFFDSILKALFSSKPWPSLKILLLTICVETAHSFGVCIFVFRLLPKLDVARAILLMNAVCTMPCCLKLFLSKSPRVISAFKRLIIFFLDAFALVMQLSVFGIVYASKFMIKSTHLTNNTSTPTTTTPTVLNDLDDFNIQADSLVFKRNKRDSLLDSSTTIESIIINSTMISSTTIPISASTTNIFDNIPTLATAAVTIAASNININLEEVITSFKIEWEFPIALMLVSLVWWENFFDRDIKCGSFKLVNMKLFKDNITATRCKTNMLSSLWKIGITLLFAYLFNPTIFNTAQIFNTPSTSSNDLVPPLSASPGDDPFFLQPPPPLPFIAKRSINNTDFHAAAQFAQSFSTLPNLFKASDFDPFNNEDLFATNNNNNNNKQQHIADIRDNWMTYLIPMIIQSVSSLICYYTGKYSKKFNQILKF